MTMTTYQTSDFLTAATLVAQKHRLLSTDNDDPRRVVFVFEDSEELKKDVLLLNRGDLKIDPNHLWAAERRCKQLIYTGERI